jgi:dUTP pyrophosphatase
MGEDLGYDVYALENTWVSEQPVLVRTGIACEAISPWLEPLGLIMKDRSSMALRGLYTHAGVIDAGYRGEIHVVLSYQPLVRSYAPYNITAGDKIGQMVPIRILTGKVHEVSELSGSDRGVLGFGSTGR